EEEGFSKREEENLGKSSVEESEIFTREEEQDQIFSLLLERQTLFAGVFPIVDWEEKRARAVFETIEYREINKGEVMIHKEVKRPYKRIDDK
ncbi:hypothetical protein HAX54_049244, partial [Datura stramonium]|nr:hypothetical protein [Datura stramonium]